MKRLNYFTLIVMLNIGFVSAQVPNAGFEEWTSQGFPAYLDPADWNTLNGQTNILSIHTVTRAEGGDAFAGDYAMRLETAYIPEPIDQIAPAIATTGEIDTNNETIEGGFQLSGKPDTLSGWFRYYPANGDNCDITITLFRWNESLGETEQVGEGIFTFSDTVDVYTQFVIAIEYSENVVPDTALIIISSSNPTEPKPGSVLYVDELEMTGVINAVPEGRGSLPVEYQNPVSDIWSVYVNENLEVEVSLYDINGRMMLNHHGHAGLNQIDLSDFSAGIYFFNFKSPDNYYRPRSGKILVK